MGSVVELALAVVVARRAVLARRAEASRHDDLLGDDFEISLCSPCGGHDDEQRGPRDFSHGFELHLVVVDTD